MLFLKCWSSSYSTSGGATATSRCSLPETSACRSGASLCDMSGQVNSITLVYSLAAVTVSLVRVFVAIMAPGHGLLQRNPVYGRVFYKALWKEWDTETRHERLYFRVLARPSLKDPGGPFHRTTLQQCQVKVLQNRRPRKGTGAVLRVRYHWRGRIGTT